LEIAARDGRADVKLRQNLALSYALAGKWTNARVMAAQDLSLDLVDARMTQWAEFVSPKASSQQVASLLGVKPVNDAGQPMRLALANSGQQTALAEPQVQPVFEAAVEPIVETAAATPEEVVQPAPAPVFEMAPASVKPAVYEAPLIRSETAPTKQAVVAMSGTNKPNKAQKSQESGRFVVQLGAFKSSNNAERAWNSAVNKTAELASYKPSTSRVKVKAASLYRMSVSGFTTRDAAGLVCAKVKAAGGSCFIRSQSGDAPTQWVQRGMVKVASR
jgi:cell division septation protein DedD